MEIINNTWPTLIKHILSQSWISSPYCRSSVAILPFMSGDCYNNTSHY